VDPANSPRKPVNLFADLEESVHEHRPHGPMTAGHSTSVERLPSDRGGVPVWAVFERWVTPWEAELDLLRHAVLWSVRGAAGDRLSFVCSSLRRRLCSLSKLVRCAS